MMPTLTVLYFDGCPNTPGVIDAAKKAASRLGGGWDVQTVDLEQLPREDLRRGWGSPTVLVDDRDLFGAPPPASPTMSCRHYSDGVPDTEAIVRAVRDRAAP